MRAACALVAGLVLAACARGPAVVPAGLQRLSQTLPKEDPRHVSSRDVRQLLEDTAALESRLGGYPARFADDESEDAAYREWRRLVLDARAAARPADGSEQRMWLLGELYRMGHNLGVRGTVQLADDHLSACVAQFPESAACNVSLVRLYLSIKPTDRRLERVERSLGALQESLGPEGDEAVAAEYVHLRMIQRDAPGAQRAIDAYLEKFPRGHLAEPFRTMRPTLDRGFERAPADADP